MKSMKIAVIGAGGVGGYFGGKLAASGYDVTFVARGEHLKAIRENGLKVISVSGDFAVPTAKATDQIQSIGRVDLIIAELWNKFMAICVSGLLAVTRSTYGKVRELEETRAMMRQLMREIHEIAIKAGQKLDPDIVFKTMALIFSYPYESNSSLARDVMEGKPSEIEHQNGTVVRLGRRYGVDVPVNRFIYSCILPMELAARAKANK